MIKLYFSKVKILAQMPTHITAVATVATQREKEAEMIRVSKKKALQIKIYKSRHKKMKNTKVVLTDIQNTNSLNVPDKSRFNSYACSIKLHALFVLTPKHV